MMAAREVASGLRAVAQDAHARRIGPLDLAARLAGLAERVDRLSAALERRSAPAGPREPFGIDLGAPDAALVDEGLALLDDFRLIPRPELRHSVLALVRALSPDRHDRRSGVGRRRHDTGHCS